MTLDEMLIQSIAAEADGKFIDIHRRTHDTDALMHYVHITATHLYHSGYTFETAIEIGMLWVLDAITLFGIPDDLDSLRIPMPTLEEVAELGIESHEPSEPSQAETLPPKPPGPGNPDQRAFEKLLGDIDIPDLEEPA